MKRLFFILLLATSCIASIASSPAPTPITVTVKLNASQKIWQFFFGVRTIITSFSCDRSATADDPLLPGESSTCTITLNQPAGKIGGGIQIQVVIPTPLIGGPTNGILLIPAGATTGTFTVTYPDSGMAAVLPFFAVPWSIWWEGSIPVWHADLLIPCCAQADLCGLKLEQISQEPCRIAFFYLDKLCVV